MAVTVQYKWSLPKVITYNNGIAWSEHSVTDVVESSHITVQHRSRLSAVNLLASVYSNSSKSERPEFLELQ